MITTDNVAIYATMEGVTPELLDVLRRAAGVEGTYAGPTGGEPQDSLRGFGPTGQRSRIAVPGGGSVLMEDTTGTPPPICVTLPDGRQYRWTYADWSGTRRVWKQF